MIEVNLDSLGADIEIKQQDRIAKARNIITHKIHLVLGQDRQAMTPYGDSQSHLSLGLWLKGRIKVQTQLVSKPNKEEQMHSVRRLTLRTQVHMHAAH